MKSRSHAALTKEFSQLVAPVPCKGSLKNQFYSSALANNNKNRYPDVLPYEQSRVRLMNNQHSDYINASFIPGFFGETEYISCQAPLPHTFSDFWIMVWEQNAHVVVMLTKFLEKRRVKAHCYWPSCIGEEVTFGDVCVKLLGFEQHTSDVVERKFALTYQGETRVISHFHYTEWPDFGVPSSTNSFQVLLRLANQARIDENGSLTPIVAHCSAGIGRAGTFLAVHSYLEHFEMQAGVSVPHIINKMREYRMGMVQTKEQYLFIYNIIDDVIPRKEQSSPAASALPYHPYESSSNDVCNTLVHRSASVSSMKCSSYSSVAIAC